MTINFEKDEYEKKIKNMIFDRHFCAVQRLPKIRHV